MQRLDNEAQENIKTLLRTAKNPEEATKDILGFVTETTGVPASEVSIKITGGLVTITTKDAVYSIGQGSGDITPTTPASTSIEAKPITPQNTAASIKKPENIREAALQKAYDFADRYNKPVDSNHLESMVDALVACGIDPQIVASMTATNSDRLEAAGKMDACVARDVLKALPEMSVETQATILKIAEIYSSSAAVDLNTSSKRTPSFIDTHKSGLSPS